jgi:death-on-curing protein
VSDEPSPIGDDIEVEVEFLTVEVVLALHQRQLVRFGGAAGLRDLGLLESAVAQPRASFGGTYANDGLFAMAAAYLFHIVSSHPFVDGNKRTGLLAAQVFLDVNGVTLEDDSESFYTLTMGVAEGRLDKQAVTVAFESIAKSKQDSEPGR